MVANLYIHGTEPSVNQKQEWVGGFSADVPFRGCWVGGSVLGFRGLRRGSLLILLGHQPRSEHRPSLFLSWDSVSLSANREGSSRTLILRRSPWDLRASSQSPVLFPFEMTFNISGFAVPPLTRCSSLQELHRCFRMAPLILTPTLCVGIIIPV